jgi:hypothetical protein
MLAGRRMGAMRPRTAQDEMRNKPDADGELALLMLQLREAESALASAMASGDRRRMERSMGAAADTAGNVKNLMRRPGLPEEQIASVNGRIEGVVQLMDRMAERLNDVPGMPGITGAEH